MKANTKNLSRRNIMVTKVFASIMPRFLAVSCLVAALALLPASQALATQAEGTGIVFGSLNVDLGFILDEPQQLVLYGVGTSRQEDITSLSDTKITLYRVGDGGILEEVDSNDNWQDHPSANQTREALERFNASLDPLEAAMVLSLTSGSYRLVVEPGSTGGFGYASAGAAQFTGGSGPGVGPGDGEIQGGPWVGKTSTYEVCFNVAPDGSRLTPNGSQCGDGGNSYDVNFFEGSLSGDPKCADIDFDVDWDETGIPIVNNRFEHFQSLSFLGNYRLEGTFADGVLNGTVSASILGATCTGTFSATPAQ